MKHYNFKPAISFLLSVVCLFANSCGAQEDKNKNLEISDIQVSKADQYESLPANTEEFPLPNCGGSSELSQTLGAQASIKKTVTVGGTATISAGGEVPISSVIKGKLEAEVSTVYNETFQNENSRLDSIELKAAPATHVVYVIQWVDQQYSSTVSYLLEGDTYDADYVYTLHVPKISNSYSMECPSSNLDQSPELVSPSQSILLRGRCATEYSVKADEPILIYYGGWGVEGLDLAQQWTTALNVSLSIDGSPVYGEQQLPLADLPLTCPDKDFEDSYWIYYTTVIPGLSPGEHDAAIAFSASRALPDKVGGPYYEIGDIVSDAFKIIAQ
jgi:hypothetical protein